MVGGVYLQLRDEMAGKYLTVPLNTSLKGWNARWFYMKQSHPAVHCDTNHILESQRSCSEIPNSADMEQVRELLTLIKGMRSFDIAADLLIEAHLDGPLIGHLSILESKGHGGVAVCTEGRDE